MLDVKRLLDLLEEKGLLQKEFADKIGVTEVSMSRYINGERIPRPDVLSKMADVLGVSIDYIMGRGEGKKTFTIGSSPSLNIIEEIPLMNVEKITDNEAELVDLMRRSTSNMTEQQRRRFYQRAKLGIMIVRENLLADEAMKEDGD